MQAKVGQGAQLLLLLLLLLLQCRGPTTLCTQQLLLVLLSEGPSHPRAHVLLLMLRAA